jgi:alpha-N-acetylglucosaminidase
MAAHGVDTPLAMEGQDYVWRILWRETGMSEAQVADSLSAAPFLPWQRMGNIGGYRAPLSPAGSRRSTSCRSGSLPGCALGMKPVLPAFAGYVPEAFAKAHPKARIYKMRPWEGFAPTYWLDPSDPLVRATGETVSRALQPDLWRGRLLPCRCLQRDDPPIAEDGSDATNAKYGDSIANTARWKAPPPAPPPCPCRARCASGRLWGKALRLDHRRRASRDMGDAGLALRRGQGVLDAGGHSAFLSRVPGDRMLVLDIGNDRYPASGRKRRL